MVRGAAAAGGFSTRVAGAASGLRELRPAGMIQYERMRRRLTCAMQPTELEGRQPPARQRCPEGGAMDTDLDAMSREQLIAEVRKLRNGIRKHRDSSEHDLCWHHPDLWALLREKWWRPLLAVILYGLFLHFHRNLF